MAAITGDLSITLGDGTVLTDSTDLGLAWKWAEAMHGEDWATMPYGTRVAEAGEALTALREAYEDVT